MARTTQAHGTRPRVPVSASLFLSLFAGQAGLIAISPVLADVAQDLEVSTAVAGQLRTITGMTAGVTALAFGTIARRIGLRRQLLLATGLLALGSLGSAAAPTFALLALAQVPVGAAVAIMLTAGTLAAAEWVPAEVRGRVLSWALIGQPAAWIVGMPVIGIVGERSWRYAWLVVPLAAAVLAGVALIGRADDPPSAVEAAGLRDAIAQHAVARWLGAELLANTAWAAMIVYSGAFFVETYGISPPATGLVLAIGAGAYILGNRLAASLPTPDSGGP